VNPGAAGSAQPPMVSVVNHDVPTDPVALRAKRLEQAEAAIAAARSKIERQEQHLAAAVNKAKKDRAKSHLAAAKKALAQATAHKESI